MNKQQAISRISEAKENEEIIVATFPYNICPVCHKNKKVLFVNFFADLLVESCGPCYIKLEELETICNDLFPEQVELLLG